MLKVFNSSNHKPSTIRRKKRDPTFACPNCNVHTTSMINSALRKYHTDAKQRKTESLDTIHLVEQHTNEQHNIFGRVKDQTDAPKPHTVRTSNTRKARDTVVPISFGSVCGSVCGGDLRQQTGCGDFNALAARKTLVFIIVQHVRFATGATMQTLSSFKPFHSLWVELRCCMCKPIQLL